MIFRDGKMEMREEEIGIEIEGESNRERGRRETQRGKQGMGATEKDGG